MQDNFNLKGFLRNNKLLNEGIGGYFDLIPLRESTTDWNEDNVGTLADKALDRMGKSELKGKVGDWISSKLGGSQDDEKFVAYLNDNNGEGEDVLGDAIISYFESDQDEEMNELNDLGNMEEADEDDGFIQAQRDAVGKKGSQIFDKGWEYDDDETMDTQRYSANYDRLLSLGGDQIEKAIIFLLDDGFDTEDILDFVKTVLEDNANTGD
jgi:hypothetical protein